MNINTLISRCKTVGDWLTVQPTLHVADADKWREIVNDYFVDRLRSRYLEPIGVLQTNGILAGEGFSIVAIQCSLIEFLESTAQGKNYRPRRGRQLGQYEYSESGDVFIDFLSTRQPFSATFDRATAHDFYINVRCGILHEARTKNDWTILANSSNNFVADVPQKIVYRNDFQRALSDYIKWYSEEIPTNRSLQDAFVRKYDHLTS